MKKHNKFFVCTCALFFLIFAGLTLSAILQARQENLNFNLIDAIKKYDSHRVKKLLQQGADPNTHDHREDSNIEIKDGLISWFVYFYQNAAKQGNTDDYLKSTALAISVEEIYSIEENTPGEPKHTERDLIGEALVLHGANVQRNEIQGGEGILGAACRSRFPRTVEAMILRGVDINRKDSNGNAPLVFADDPEVVDIMLKHGADPNSRDRLGLPALSCHIDNIKVVRQLIKGGADVNLKRSDSYETPLTQANRTDVVQYLLENGSDIQANAGAGFSVMDCVVDHMWDWSKKRFKGDGEHLVCLLYKHGGRLRHYAAYIKLDTEGFK